jgi:hypothetical protein
MDWWILTIATGLAATTSLSAQAPALGRLSGVVRDTLMNPVAGAQVIVKGTVRLATTDSMGMYRLDSVPVGVQAIKLYAIGYYVMEISRIEVESGVTLQLNIQLIPVYQNVTECLTVESCKAAKKE